MSPPGRLRSALARGQSGSARPQVFLHIGAMKTGTTYLQGLMDANRASLAQAGLRFPGEEWAQQSLATQQIMKDADDTSLWSSIVAEMVTDPAPTSVLSMEFLSFADEAQATRVLSSFPDDVDVHVVLTVRDAAATIPAQWQTNCRNRGKVPWPRFVRGVRKALEAEGAPQGKGARIFERTQGVPRMLGTWVPLVGQERTHVVTVPPRGSDPTLLWRRFADVVGVDPAAAPEPPAESNPSLGHPSTELLRRVNRELKGVERRPYERVVRGRLSRKVLGPRAPEEHPIVMHQQALRLAARWNRQVREAVESHGVPVVGDLDELPVQPRLEGAPTKPAVVSRRDLLAAAACARDGLLRYRAVLESDADDEDEGSGGATGDPTPWTRWGRGPDAVDAAAREVGELTWACIALVKDRQDGDADGS